VIRLWAAALADGDAERREEIEAGMSRIARLKNLSQNEFNILAACVGGGEVDVVEAVGQVDLVRAVSAEEGPWVMTFRRPAIDAVAGMSVDQPLVDRWVRHTIELNGGAEGYYRKLLTADAAEASSVGAVGQPRRTGSPSLRAWMRNVLEEAGELLSGPWTFTAVKYPPQMPLCYGSRASPRRRSSSCTRRAIRSVWAS
jgi:hypothetical protein